MLKSIKHTGYMAAIALGCACTAAQGATVVTAVAGSANPYLAGALAGTSCCGGDSAPAQSPSLVAGSLVAGSSLTFSGTGGFNYAGGSAYDSLDGQHSGQSLTYIFGMPADNGTGIAGASGVNVSGLLGVFLGDGVPSGPAPAGLNYSVLGLDAASYTPGLNQIFWIGDGLTGTGTGSIQSFVVPVGATRLFLGSADGAGWYDNSGQALVTVNGVTVADAVPEPASWALLIGGFALAGGILRRRNTARAVSYAS